MQRGIGGFPWVMCFGEKPQNTLPYETPSLNIYRDMGDLLALDPPMQGMAETPWQKPAGEETGMPNR